MQITKNQHKIPRLLVKQWGNPVHYVDNPKGRLKILGIKGVAKDDYFYDVEDPYQPNEHAFQEIENAITPIFDKIIQAESLTNLTPNERFVIASFLYFQYNRTDKGRSLMQRKIEIQNNLGIPRQKLERNIGTREVHMAWTFSSMNFDQIVRIFNFKWILIRNSTSCGFFLSDNPVICENPFSNPEDVINSVYGSSLHAEDARAFCVRFLLPITPRLMLFVYEHSIKDYYPEIPDMETGEYDIKSIYFYNYRVLRHSFTYTYMLEGDYCKIEEIDRFWQENSKKFKGIKHWDMNSREEIHSFFELLLKIDCEWSNAGDLNRLFKKFTRFEIGTMQGKIKISFMYNRDLVKMVKFDLKDIKNTLETINRTKNELDNGNPTLDLDSVPFIRRLSETMLKDVFGSCASQITYLGPHIEEKENIIKISFSLDLWISPDLHHPSRQQVPDIIGTCAWAEWTRKKLVQPPRRID